MFDGILHFIAMLHDIAFTSKLITIFTVHTLQWALHWRTSYCRRNSVVLWKRLIVGSSTEAGIHVDNVMAYSHYTGLGQ